jgi:polar amino acid transport system substrate-binding protein
LHQVKQLFKIGGMDILRHQLAPQGEIRVGLNLSNALLVNQAGGLLSGIAPALGEQIAQELGVSHRFHPFATPSALAKALADGECDIGFLANEASRGGIAFTPAYLDLDAGYLAASHFRAGSAAEVDDVGVRIAVPEASAYGLWLARNVKNARIVPAADAKEALRLFREQGLEALAGLKTRLLQDAAAVPGSRVLEGRFTAVQQSVGLPPAHAEGLAFLREFILRQRRSGRIAELVRLHGITGVSVASDE